MIFFSWVATFDGVQPGQLSLNQLQTLIDKLHQQVIVDSPNSDIIYTCSNLSHLLLTHCSNLSHSPTAMHRRPQVGPVLFCQPTFMRGPPCVVVGARAEMWRYHTFCNQYSQHFTVYKQWFTQILSSYTILVLLIYNYASSMYFSRNYGTTFQEQNDIPDMQLNGLYGQGSVYGVRGA